MEQPAYATLTQTQALLALGGNLASAHGDPAQTLDLAIRRLGEAGLQVLARSRFFTTPAMPVGAGPDYVNAALVVETDLPPEALLVLLHGVEADLGRARSTRWASRPVDIDLLAQGDRILPDVPTQARWRALPPDRQQIETPERLILPHPRLQDRAFVLIPLADIAPGWRHPILGLSTLEMLDQLPEADKSAIKPL